MDGRIEGRTGRNVQLKEDAVPFIHSQTQPNFANPLVNGATGATLGSARYTLMLRPITAGAMHTPHGTYAAVHLLFRGNG
jgi:hypothetical protein